MLGSIKKLLGHKLLANNIKNDIQSDTLDWQAPLPKQPVATDPLSSFPYDPHGSTSETQAANLSQENYDRLIKQKNAVYFPLPSIITALLLIGMHTIINIEPLKAFYEIPELLAGKNANLITLGLFALIVLFDTQRHIKKRRIAAQQFNELKTHLSNVWQSKKKQQQKANTLSGHAEKLKLFISDRLLEYIEYDEKFLHFKGIASEVRHNGVISYDKVITALNKAIEQQQFLSIYEQNEQAGAPNEQTLDSLSKYQNAIDAMRYLWSLLDLSTADNMALHIGNQLIECEEHFYQLNLDTEQKLDITQSIPVTPTFYPQVAALMTFSLLTDETEIRNQMSLAKLNAKTLEEDFSFENSLLRIQLKSTPELLGNPNHIILLLENLIKNAQFFSQKSRFKQKSDRISILLRQGSGYAHFTIYNRGPTINDTDKAEIFKLGFSTRRSKQHHGKGLGLFFTSEIIKGYQGDIQVTNIEAASVHYRLKLGLASGEFQMFEFDCILNEDKMEVVTDHREPSECFTVSLDIPVISIEIESNDAEIPACNMHIEEKQAIEWLEPSPMLRPHWLIQTSAYKKHQKFTFRPLDTRGVQFDIKIPTAESRLNDVEVDFENEEN